MVLASVHPGSRARTGVPVLTLNEPSMETSVESAQSFLGFLG